MRKGFRIGLEKKSRGFIAGRKKMSSNSFGNGGNLACSICGGLFLGITSVRIAQAQGHSFSRLLLAWTKNGERAKISGR